LHTKRWNCGKGMPPRQKWTMFGVRGPCFGTPGLVLLARASYRRTMAMTIAHWNVKGAMPSQSLASAAQLLARAFFADPLFAHVQPSERTRRRGLPTLFETLLRDAQPRGGVVSTSEGVVAWTPAHRLHANLLAQIWRGYSKVPLHLGFGASLRLQAHDDWCNRRTQAHSSPEAAYIHCVGVEPALAGQGIGSTLMDAALSRIRQSCGLCALRTEQPRNVRFYEKLGFRCVEQLEVPTTGLPAWFFVREL
jgi:ribosomal protein S18 acetylase RimI-like enzyme